jgi:hypothetical protein
LPSMPFECLGRHPLTEISPSSGGSISEPRRVDQGFQQTVPRDG